VGGVSDVDVIRGALEGQRAESEYAADSVTRARCDDALAALASLEAERDAWKNEANARRERKTLCEQLEATVARQGEALREIDNYARYGTPWNAYVDVKRIAKAALAYPPAHDCSAHTVTADEGTTYCAECERDAT
jgi:hypothetical protein